MKQQFFELMDESYEGFSSKKLSDAVFDGIVSVIVSTMDNRYKKSSDGSAVLELPCGKFIAEKTLVGDSYVTNVTFDASKDFLDVLSGNLKTMDPFYMEESKFINLNKDFIDIGIKTLTTNDGGNKSVMTFSVDVIELALLANLWSSALCKALSIGLHDGQVYEVPIENFGVFSATLKNDEVRVVFSADKIFKQRLKDDSINE